jgi:hypothetical protein
LVKLVSLDLWYTIFINHFAIAYLRTK